MSAQLDQITSRLPADEASGTVPIPVPTLTPEFRMVLDLVRRVPVGAGPWGVRNWIPFSGGRWSSSWGNGTIISGGQDSQIVQPDSLAAWLDASYVIETDDDEPAYMTVHLTGWRTGPKEVMQRLAVPELAGSVDPKEYLFRLFVRLETGDPRYADKVNTGMWVGSGIRRGLQVIFDGYRIG